MAGDAKKLQPIIIKRIKKGGHATHGGAWKIAYADFVTAMMAFFLLMWLLGSTTEGDKKGIADYFGSPLKIALMSSGSGAGDSSHVIKGGGEDLTRTTGQVKRGDVTAERSTINLHALKAEQVRAEISRLEDLKRKVEEKIAANPKLAPLRSQIKLDMTRDGLRIQIVDDAGRAMFDSGSASVQPHMRELLREIGAVLGEVPNRLTLEGRPGQRVASGTGGRRAARRPHAARAGAGGVVAIRPQRPRGPGQPAHQHHRDEPRGRGPLLPHRARTRGGCDIDCTFSGTEPGAGHRGARHRSRCHAIASQPLNDRHSRGPHHEQPHRTQVPDRR
jgi:flagellar motor protein MotB